MLRYSLYALLGAYSLQAFPTLPPAGVVAALSVIALIAFAQRRYVAMRPAAVIVLGGAIMWLAADAQLADRLSPDVAGKTLMIPVRVIEFPVQKNNAIRLVVSPLERDDLPSRIRLSWYAPAAHDGALPALGEIWQFQVRLRRPRGFSNPNGFDYEGWLFRQHIGATGYVFEHAERMSSANSPPGFSMILRRHLAARIEALFPPGESRAVLKAITVGDRGDISDSQWQLYARTGVSHLMAISGLHIGLAASGSFILAWALFAMAPGHRNLRDGAMVIAIVVAFCYAELSGFAVPARRAFGMALLAATAVLMRRQVSVPHVLGTVCLLVFIGDPLSIYAPGFMLSFLAVVLLLWAARSHVPTQGSTPWWRGSRLIAAATGLTRIQMVLLLGLMPMTIALFGRVAILAPLTNMLVVPIFSLLTVPASLLGLVCDGPLKMLGDPLLKLAFASVEIALSIIEVVGDVPATGVQPPLNGYRVLLISGATVAWAILPAGWPGRHVAIVAFVATLLYKPAGPAENCLDFHALDVGQGLAVVLRAHDHTFVYDTGPSFRGGSSTAKLVIGPFLKSLGLSRIDLLLVSHSDLDHSGGVAWLTAEFDIGQLLLGEELEVGGARGLPCSTGQEWRWGGVHYRILHPEYPADWHGNNGSCVLLVQVGKHKLLIPGDIESPAERAFKVPPVDMVLVPHHGSRTSSSPGFVAALKPSLAVVSAGFGNRWGFPKPEIVARWEAQGAMLVSTASAGAISRRYCAGQAAGPLYFGRERARRYWHDPDWPG